MWPSETFLVLMRPASSFFFKMWSCIDLSLRPLFKWKLLSTANCRPLYIAAKYFLHQKSCHLNVWLLCSLGWLDNFPIFLATKQLWKVLYFHISFYSLYYIRQKSFSQVENERCLVCVRIDWSEIFENVFEKIFKCCRNNILLRFTLNTIDESSNLLSIPCKLYGVCVKMPLDASLRNWKYLEAIL